MAPRRLPYDDYAPGRNLFWEAPEDNELIEPYAWPAFVGPEDGDAGPYVRGLFQHPLFGEPAGSTDVPDLRSAGREKLKSAGLHGDAATPVSFEPTPESAADANVDRRPRSWKLPARMLPGPSDNFDNDSAASTSAPPAESGNVDAIDSDAAGLALSRFDNAAQPEANQKPSAASPLDHPDAHTGLALTAADSVLRRGVEAVAEMTGGNRALLQQIVEGAVALLGKILPPEYKASAARTGETALADAHRRIDERERDARTRAAIGTLANRRVEAEQGHVEAMITGDRATIAEARREAIDAWRAERRARGDGESEINAGARLLDAQYRKTALRHRFAQMDEAGIKRALDEDEDAKSDPVLAREVAGDIQRIRREDPARVGEASNERKIAEKKRDGRIDTPEEEKRERYKLRLEAQAQRGIPEDRRRLLTNAERTALALEYHRIESASGKAAADKWLDEQTQQAGPHAQRFKAEIAAPPRGSVQWRELDQAPAPSQRQIAELPGTAGNAPRPSEADQGRVEPAQDNKDPAAPPAPGSPRLPPATEAERSAREEEISKEISERHSALPRDDWRARIDLIVEISKREGFVPFIVRQRLWEQIVTADRRVSIEERLASAHAIAELQRLFPQDIERHLFKGDLAVIAEIVRLDEEGKTDADKIVDTAKKNTGYPDFRLIFGAIGGMRGGRSVRRIGETRPLTPEELARKQRQMTENRTVGGIAEEQGRQIIIRDIERMKVSAWPKRLVRIEGDRGTIPDLPIGTNSDQIRLYVDVKKYGARHPEPQRSRLRALGAHIVEINPKNGDMRALAPPYDRWISYDEWLRLAEELLSQEPQ